MAQHFVSVLNKHLHFGPLPECPGRRGRGQCSHAGLQRLMSYRNKLQGASSTFEEIWDDNGMPDQGRACSLKHSSQFSKGVHVNASLAHKVCSTCPRPFSGPQHRVPDFHWSSTEASSGMGQRSTVGSGTGRSEAWCGGGGLASGRAVSDEVPCRAQLLQNHFLLQPQTLRVPCLP